MDKLAWSEKYRQAGVVLATFWGVLAAIVIVLTIYASQQQAQLADAPQPVALAPGGLSHVWLDVPPLEGEALPLAPEGFEDEAPIEEALEEAVEEPVPSLPPQEAESAPLPAPAIEPVPEPAPEVAEIAPAPAPIVEAPVPVVEPAPAPAPVVKPAPEPAPEPARLTPPRDIFVVLLGGGEDMGLLDALPANTAIVMGVIDETMGNFVAKAHAKNIQVLLPLPVAAAGPLPNLAAEPDENRQLFAAFLDKLPPVDGLYIPAGHPFNKDMASFAALLDEAKARGLKVIGTLPANLQSPTTPLPVHHAVDAEMLAGDAGNMEGVLFVLTTAGGGVTVITGPADRGFARAFARFAAKTKNYHLKRPEGF